MKTLDFQSALSVRTAGEGVGTFEGHAAVFDTPDRMGELIRRGAFTKTLKQGNKKIKMLRQHDQSAIIGVWEELREEKDSLVVRGRLLVDDLPAAREAHVLLREEALDGLSIGFIPVKDQFNRETEQTEILELELFEISLVAIPRQAGATVTAVRDFSPEELTTKTELEKALRNAGFSKSISKYVVAGWTPPALRDVEGGSSEMAKRMNALVKSLQTATGEIQNG